MSTEYPDLCKAFHAALKKLQPTELGPGLQSPCRNVVIPMWLVARAPAKKTCDLKKKQPLDTVSNPKSIGFSAFLNSKILANRKVYFHASF